MAEALHEKYVPILRYARGERFYPMPVEDFLGYCTLRARNQALPLLERGRVEPGLLARVEQQAIDTYLQSVPASLADQNVAATWNADVVRAMDSSRCHARRHTSCSLCRRRLARHLPRVQVLRLDEAVWAGGLCHGRRGEHRSG